MFRYIVKLTGVGIAAMLIFLWGTSTLGLYEPSVYDLEPYWKLIVFGAMVIAAWLIAWRQRLSVKVAIAGFILAAFATGAVLLVIAIVSFLFSGFGVF